MPKDNSKPTRERRAREAQERQAERATRSNEEQIAFLDAQGHAASKERKRLA